jgi:uncharacterized protein (DUF1697 family)
MATYIGLLRGVNVGGKNMIAMAELRRLFESIGYGNVRTFIQSGNVLFEGPAAPSAHELEAAIASHFALTINVAIRTPRELRTVVASNPFPSVDASKLHVGFFSATPSRDVVANLDHERFESEHFRVQGRECVLFLPNGTAQSKLPDYLNRQLKVPVTIRNWNTVTRLLELAKS